MIPLPDVAAGQSAVVTIGETPVLIGRAAIFLASGIIKTSWLLPIEPAPQSPHNVDDEQR
jgi:hypothetical protein